jgi:SAM-dependent methyltransferase
MAQRSEGSITTKNRDFYDGLWSRARLQRPERFNTWPMIAELLPSAPMRLELGPGLHPRLPIAGTHFIDLSAPSVRQLNGQGGIAAVGDMARLPFPDGAFDLVAAFDVIEHIVDDRQVFLEISRVLKDGGVLVFSVPLHAGRWTAFDEMVGHVRRYAPGALTTLLAECGLTLERSAGFGMKPANGRLVRWGMWWLSHHPAKAIRWYNRVFLPLGIFFQKPLHFARGLIDTADIQGVVLVCRRRAP